MIPTNLNKNLKHEVLIAQHPISSFNKAKLFINVIIGNLINGLKRKFNAIIDKLRNIKDLLELYFKKPIMPLKLASENAELQNYFDKFLDISKSLGYPEKEDILIKKFLENISVYDMDFSVDLSNLDDLLQGIKDLSKGHVDELKTTQEELKQIEKFKKLVKQLKDKQDISCIKKILLHDIICIHNIFVKHCNFALKVNSPKAKEALGFVELFSQKGFSHGDMISHRHLHFLSSKGYFVRMLDFINTTHTLEKNYLSTLADYFTLGSVQKPTYRDLKALQLFAELIQAYVLEDEKITDTVRFIEILKLAEYMCLLPKDAMDIIYRRHTEEIHKKSKHKTHGQSSIAVHKTYEKPNASMHKTYEKHKEDMCKIHRKLTHDTSQLKIQEIMYILVRHKIPNEKIASITRWIPGVPRIVARVMQELQICPNF